MQEQGELWASDPYESLLRRRLLPVPLAPIDGESLSGWVVRLADAHAMSVQALSAWLMGRGRQAFGEDVDRGAWQELLVALARATERPLADVQAGTLKRFEGSLWGELPKNGLARWVLPVGKQGTLRTGYGVQFCSGCLSSDAKPHLRLNWRLGFVVCCSVHHCLLEDRCGRCGAPVAAHRWRTGKMQRLGTTGIICCHVCGADRREVTEKVPVSGRLEEAQTLMVDALEQGWACVSGGILHSLAFFAGASIIWSMLDDQRALGRVRALFGLDEPPGGLLAKQRFGGFEGKDVRHRAWLLQAFGALMADGVDAMFVRLGAGGLRSQDVLRYSSVARRSAPYWMWRATRDHLDRSFYVPSDEEISQTISWQLKERGGAYARIGDVCESLGMRTRHSARVGRQMRSMGVVRRRQSGKS